MSVFFIIILAIATWFVLGVASFRYILPLVDDRGTWQDTDDGLMGVAVIIWPAILFVELGVWLIDGKKNFNPLAWLGRLAKR